MTAPEEEVQGVNDRAQLAAVERDLQNRLRTAAMASGVTLIAPETVFFSYDTQIGRDTVVEPRVFGPGVVIDENVIIHAFSHLEGAHVASGGTVGPFCSPAAGSVPGPKAKVGNFVEIKNVDLGAGAKVSHLTYLGDASVGAEVNIGAGTVTCNYDGYRAPDRDRPGRVHRLELPRGPGHHRRRSVRGLRLRHHGDAGGQSRGR